ncbi:glycoside hydrolase family 28 protein [Scleroderma yunnanense]
MYHALMLAPLFTVSAAIATSRSSNCTGEISSLNDISAAVRCTTVNINSFTVPAGETFSLDLLDGTTVNVRGDIEFGNKLWGGPLFHVQSIFALVNGNGYKWDGGGPYYWDGKGLGGGVTKPHIMMDVGTLTVSGVTVDNSQGDYSNSKSNGAPAGHNTDGFNINGDDVTIENCFIYNQDDCIAIKEGSNILLQGNYCSGGHGISIGSISSGVVVNGVSIVNNTIKNSLQAFHIKTDVSATSGTVANVVYNGNIADKLSDYGILISQSYPGALGTPGNGVLISVTTDSGAYMVAVNCGQGSCTGTWDWSSLETSGGKVGPITNNNLVTGFTPRMTQLGDCIIPFVLTDRMNYVGISVPNKWLAQYYYNHCKFIEIKKHNQRSRPHTYKIQKEEEGGT